MSELERSRSRTPRRTREKRAYQLVLATAGFGIAGTVGLLIAIVTDFGAGLPILALVIAAVCGLLFRRAVS